MSQSPKKSRKKRKRQRKAGATVRHSLKPLLPYLPFIAPIAVTAFAYMWIYTDMNIKAMPITKLKEQARELRERNDSIRHRIEELQAPGRIESIAQEKLGMITPEEYRVVVLDEPMWPPGIAGQTQRPAEKHMQAKRESEGIFGFLGISERETKVEDVPQKTASGRSVRQPG